MSIEKFQAYYAAGAGIEIDKEEVECVLANMVFKVRASPVVSYRDSSLTLVLVVCCRA
jgi:hypothetical protein